MESGGWRSQLQAASRERMVNRIMVTLKKCLTFSGREGLQELNKIAVRLEEKIYTSATSQIDYLQKISLKMLAFEPRLQIPGFQGYTLESGDWRVQLHEDSRQRIVNKIMDTMKRHVPFSGHEGLQELEKIADRFEDRIYTTATSLPDYLRKISLRMLTMETTSQDPVQSNYDPVSKVWVHGLKLLD